MLAAILLFSLNGVQMPTVAAQTASPPDDRDRVTCRSRHRLGSRIAVQRVCMTADEWRIYENDKEQSRRDIADRGARGCDVSQRTGTAVGQC